MMTRDGNKDQQIDCSSLPLAANFLETTSKIQSTAQETFDESAWIAVIQGLEASYSKSICYQAEVERKNAELSKAYNEIKQVNEILVNTQQQLIHAEKMAALGRMVAGIAHELNTPMGVVVGNLWSMKQSYQELSELLTPDVAQKSQVADLMSELKDIIIANDSAIQHISQIIKDLRSFSAKDNALIESMRLSPVLHRAATWVLSNALNHIDIVFALDDALMVLANEGKLQQVIINLVRNAVDALESVDQPCIMITSSPLGRYAQILVRDNGKGIPSEQMDKLFEPFYTSKEVSKGMGLGLSISFGLVQEMHGKITAWNHLDHGAVFEILLPLQLPESRS